MNKKISVANLVMLAGGAVTLLFSFFAFTKFGDNGFSAWNGDAGAFATTVPAILAIAMIAVCICEMAGVNLPSHVLTFNWNQIKATWGISAAGIMLSWITVGDLAYGAWVMFLGSLAMAAGGVMALLGKGNEVVDLGAIGSNPSSSSPPPPPPSGMTPPPPPPPPG
jgi:hypothetical protein